MMSGYCMYSNAKEHTALYLKWPQLCRTWRRVEQVNGTAAEGSALQLALLGPS